MRILFDFNNFKQIFKTNTVHLYKQIKLNRKMVDSSKFRTLATNEDPALKRSFRGHKDTILAVSFNPNM